MAYVYDFVQVIAYTFSDIGEYADNFTHAGGHYYSFDEFPFCELQDEDRSRIASMIEKSADDFSGFLVVCVERESVQLCDRDGAYDSGLKLTDAGLVTMGRNPSVKWALAEMEAQPA